MSALPRDALAQRADYTHRHNAGAGCYGWLRLTFAYSLKIVNEILTARAGDPGNAVLDPFCGTGTTALCGACHGRQAVTTDVNPFLVWLGNAKTDYYSPALIAKLRGQGRDRCAAHRKRTGRALPHPQCAMLNAGGTLSLWIFCAV